MLFRSLVDLDSTPPFINLSRHCSCSPRGMSLYNATKSHGRGRKLSRHSCEAERMILRKRQWVQDCWPATSTHKLSLICIVLGISKFPTTNAIAILWIYPTSETSRYSVVHASRRMTWLVSHVRTWDDTKRGCKSWYHGEQHTAGKWSNGRHCRG